MKVNPGVGISALAGVGFVAESALVKGVSATANVARSEGLIGGLASSEKISREKVLDFAQVFGESTTAGIRGLEQGGLEALLAEKMDAGDGGGSGGKNPSGKGRESNATEGSKELASPSWNAGEPRGEAGKKADGFEVHKCPKESGKGKDDGKGDYGNNSEYG